LKQESDLSRPHLGGSYQQKRIVSCSSQYCKHCCEVRQRRVHVKPSSLARCLAEYHVFKVTNGTQCRILSYSRTDSREISWLRRKQPCIRGITEKYASDQFSIQASWKCCFALATKTCQASSPPPPSRIFHLFPQISDPAARAVPCFSNTSMTDHAQPIPWTESCRNGIHFLFSLWYDLTRQLCFF
jgi:hypothetical protein